MLEIICLIWLWRVNGKHAIERGQNPKKYRALTLGLWFGLEFTGTFVGAWLMQLLNAGDNAFYGAYFFGIIGAAIGGFTSYWVAKKAPMGNYRPEDQPNGWNNQSGGWNQSQSGWDNQQNGWNQNQNSWDNQQNGWNQNQNSWDNQQNGWNQNQNGWNNQQNGWNRNQNGWDNQQNVWEQPQQEPDCLFTPATIHIIEEEGGYTGGQDAFFLNGRPICSLRPGSEYTFTTYAKKNVLTIGRPTPEPSDETTVLKFIAGEKGQIEIHACTGRLLPGKFSNYTA